MHYSDCSGAAASAHRGPLNDSCDAACCCLARELPLATLDTKDCVEYAEHEGAPNTGLWVPRTVSRRLTSAFATGPTPEAVARTPAGTIARCGCPTRIPGARPSAELTGAAPPLRRNQGHRDPRAPTRARRSAPTQPTPRAGELVQPRRGIAFSRRRAGQRTGRRLPPNQARATARRHRRDSSPIDRRHDRGHRRYPARRTFAFTAETAKETPLTCTSGFVQCQVGCTNGSTSGNRFSPAQRRRPAILLCPTASKRDRPCPAACSRPVPTAVPVRRGTRTLP